MIIKWLLLLEPLAGGLVCYSLRSDRLRRLLLILFAAGHLALVLAACYPGPETTLQSWIGIDSLSLIFLVITSFLFLAVSIYTAGYLSGNIKTGGSEKPKHYFSREAVFTGTLLIFLTSMTLAIMSRHTGIFWMAVEATTLSSAPLISYHRSAQTLEATWKYLLICSVGIGLALVGNIALSVSASFDPSLKDLPSTFQELTVNAGALQKVWLKAAFMFLLIGYGTKMGLAPMHTWLPDAHSEAPSPVSALLSGALLNCAFLGIIRINGILINAGLADFSNTLLLFFGVLSMLLAGVFIVRQANFKRMLAYSSIEHMGILSIAIGAGATTSLGAVYHALNHSLTKGFLFLVAGNILGRFNTKATRDVRGLVQALPVSGMLWTFGFLAICGVPPFSVFTSEFMILTGLAQAQQWLVFILMLLALGIIFIGMAWVMIPMAFGSAPQLLPGGEKASSPFICLAPPVVLCLIVLILGCWLPQPLFHLLEQAAIIAGGH